ncbi:hypothetical protein Ciccas_005044, partial [Cichlidogyrus casuarinus]
MRSLAFFVWAMATALSQNLISDIDSQPLLHSLVLEPEYTDSSFDPSFEPTLPQNDVNRNNGNSGEIACNMLKCFVFQQDGIRIFDCQEPRTDVTVRFIHNRADSSVYQNLRIVAKIDCIYWLKVQDSRISNELKAKMVLRPAKSSPESLDHRLDVDMYVFYPISIVYSLFNSFAKGATKRLVDLFTNSLFASPPDKKTSLMLGITLSFIKMGLISTGDVQGLIQSQQLISLTIWNPKKWSEDGFIPAKSEQTVPYFRLNIFCEETNNANSFDKLWLPWYSWQIKFNHCRDRYRCHRWLANEPICRKDSGGPFEPRFLAIPENVAKERDGFRLESLSEAPTYDVQILRSQECRPIHPPMLKLQKSSIHACWTDDETLLASTTTTTTPKPTTRPLIIPRPPPPTRPPRPRPPPPPPPTPPKTTARPSTTTTETTSLPTLQAETTVQAPTTVITAEPTDRQKTNESELSEMIIAI